MKSNIKLSLNKETIQDLTQFSEPIPGYVPPDGGPAALAAFTDIPTIDIPSPNDHSCIMCVPGSSCSTKDIFSWNIVVDGNATVGEENTNV